MHRFATITLSLGLLLGLSGSHHLRAQGDSKNDETPKSEPSKPEASKEEPPKPDASAATESALPPIPPEVEAKLEAARRAVAEAIVAAQDAGLVKTTIDPPPILDILITGRANDESTLKARSGVSPEVFGAWFTGYGTTKDITPQKDVRITRPDAGLKEMFNQRANILNRHLEAARKAKGVAKKDESPRKEDATEKPPAATEKNDKKDEPAKEDNKDGDAKKNDSRPEARGNEAKKDNSEANLPKEDAKKDDINRDGSKDDTPDPK